MDAEGFHHISNKYFNLPLRLALRILAFNLVNFDLIDSNLIVNFIFWVQVLIILIVFVKLTDLDVAIKCQGYVWFAIEVFKTFHVHDLPIFEGIHL